MSFSRRSFFKGLIGTAGGALVVSRATPADSIEMVIPNPDWYGCLMDITLCVGCRKCEAACNESNKLPPPDVSFEEKAVLEKPRRPTHGAFTVVNKYTVEESKEPVFVKFQCMHCNDAACVSACIVGALKKNPETGAVTYDPSKCLGCRYCMVACPFQIPAYEYHDALAPRVRKCEFCFEKIKDKGGVPACVKVCPKEALIFGKRTELIKLAHEKIVSQPHEYREKSAYQDQVYGQYEVGGTGWMYLSAVPFEKIGFLALPDEAPPRLTEKIQHSIFKGFTGPIALFSLLGIAMNVFKDRGREAEKSEKHV